jgi:hypothetical protein
MVYFFVGNPPLNINVIGAEANEEASRLAVCEEALPYHKTSN